VKPSTITAFVLLLLLTSISVRAQISKPESPQLTLSGRQYGWDVFRYPDGRLLVTRTGDSTLVVVPVSVKNCWQFPYTSYEVFPITSFNVPVQYDSGALEFVGIDTTGLATNFTYTSSDRLDTTYMDIVGASRELRQRGRRVTISAHVREIGDSLAPTGDLDWPCDHYVTVVMFSLVFRLKADAQNDPTSLRTPLIIRNDSLTYNDLTVFDKKWANPVQEPYRGLGGIDNHYLDANNNEQTRDPLRPLRRGMIWMEIIDSIGSIAFDSDSIENIDTVFMRMPWEHRWRDTAIGQGYCDVLVSNSIVKSRIQYVEVSTAKNYLLFRSVKQGILGELDPFPKITSIDTISYLDNGILGVNGLLYPNGEFTYIQRPLRIRIYKIPVRDIWYPKDFRFIGYVDFSSSSMIPPTKRLYVVVDVYDTTSTSIERENELASMSLSVHPNPSSGNTTFTVKTLEDAVLEISTITGQVAETFAVQGSPTATAVHLLSRYPAGVYVVVLRSSKRVETQRFVIVK